MERRNDSERVGAILEFFAASIHRRRMLHTEHGRETPCCERGARWSESPHPHLVTRGARLPLLQPHAQEDVACFSTFEHRVIREMAYATPVALSKSATQADVISNQHRIPAPLIS